MMFFVFSLEKAKFAFGNVPSSLMVSFSLFFLSWKNSVGLIHDHVKYLEIKLNNTLQILGCE